MPNSETRNRINFRELEWNLLMLCLLNSSVVLMVTWEAEPVPRVTITAHDRRTEQDRTGAASQEHQHIMETSLAATRISAGIEQSISFVFCFFRTASSIAACPVTTTTSCVCGRTTENSSLPPTAGEQIRAIHPSPSTATGRRGTTDVHSDSVEKKREDGRPSRSAR
jgi:hypothetical protein